VKWVITYTSSVQVSAQPPAKKTAGQIEKETLHDVVLFELYGIGCQKFGSWNAECGKQEKAQEAHHKFLNRRVIPR
jgi:hypothetical protein